MNHLDIKFFNGNTARYSFDMVREPILAGDYVKLTGSTRLSPDGNQYLDLVVSSYADSDGFALGSYNPCDGCIFIIEEY